MEVTSGETLSRSEVCLAYRGGCEWGREAGERRKPKGRRLFASLRLKRGLSASEKFERLFADKFGLDSSRGDRLLVDEFSCALLRGKSLLVHGTLYTTRKYFAFHSNIFGFETFLIKPWTDVSYAPLTHVQI
jgi:hypothetical protein